MSISNRGKPQAPPRILKYRNQVKIAEFTIKLLAYFLIIFISFLYIGLIYSEQFSFYIVFLWLGKVSSIVISDLLIRKLITKPLVSSEIQVFEDKIFIKKNNKEETIYFKDVKKINSNVNKNIGGWISLVLNNNKKYRFTVVLERVEYILEALIKYNPDLLDKDKYINLRKHLILSDHSLARLYNFCSVTSFLKIFTVVSFLLAFYFSLYYFNQVERYGFSFDYVDIIWQSMFFWIISYIVFIVFLTFTNIKIDKNFSKKLEEFPNNKVRDINYEKYISRKYFPYMLASLFVIISCINLSDLNILGLTWICCDEVAIEKKAGASVWYDVRYSGESSGFKLKIGDIVLGAKKGKFAEVIGLPGDFIMLNNMSSQRNLASGAREKVLENQVAVKTHDGLTGVVELKSVKGKVLKNITDFF